MAPAGDASIPLLCSVDGHIAPASEATISITDDGFLRGDGAFEMLKLYEGRPFGMVDHLDRLDRSAAVRRSRCWHRGSPTTRSGRTESRSGRLRRSLECVGTIESFRYIPEDAMGTRIPGIVQIRRARKGRRVGRGGLPRPRLT